MKIGAKIKQVLIARGHTSLWLAERIGCERTNVYNIFQRDDVSIALLRKISILLGYDFFHDLSMEYFDSKGRLRKDKG